MIQNDTVLDIAVGMSRTSKKWKNKKISWSELVQKLSEGQKTNVTYHEYISATKTEQAQIKDNGGYVGGYLLDGKRSPSNVLHRQLATLDIDFAHMGFWDDYVEFYDSAAVLHSTHTHHEKNPRFRLILPLSRECTPDEYIAVTRRIAGNLGIDLFDNTTFETNRLMYWPSCPKDVDYYFRKQDGPLLDVDEILGSYVDWKDVSAWPTSGEIERKVLSATQKQQDPTLKRGMVGVFCRTYSVKQAIDRFLPDDYISAGDGRYTYSKGSTHAGAIVYEDKFIFSHHGTDPCGGKLCNAYDMVRLHIFGHEDEGNDTDTKSVKAMNHFAREDENVRQKMAAETLESAKYDFSEYENTEETHPTEVYTDWMKDLEIDPKGKYKSSAPNLNLIFNNDPRLKDCFKENSFDRKKYVFKNLPWRKVKAPEGFRDVDTSGTRNYIETVYGISNAQKVSDCLAIEFEKQSYHPVKEYLSGLDWDGTSRVGTLFSDYFGAVQNEYTRQAARKMLVGAISRVYVPGIKFDLVITFVGEEGTGKSTFIDKLAGPWFSDTLTTIEGKEGLEQLQGAWIIELAELSALEKSKVEKVKHFISKRVDMYRGAFKAVAESYPRQCIFVATTNNGEFLKGNTGNRRFIPIDVRKGHNKKSVFDDLDQKTVDQIWAEALTLYKLKEPLYMTGNAANLALQQQTSHTVTDTRSGTVENFINLMLPSNWEDLGLPERLLLMETGIDSDELKHREVVCAAEIWCECFKRDIRDMSKYNTREINNILKDIPGWEKVNSTKNFKFYGKQRYYRRK